jgi:hypothetical protein
MSAYRSAGAGDDVQFPMGDKGFVRLNMRLEPDLLRAGEIQLSENGRLERNSWQPRKAIDNLSGSLQIDGDPLRLPFYLVDLAGGEPITSATRSGTTVTVTLTNSLFSEAGTGHLGIEDLTGSVDPNGVRLITVIDPSIFTFEIPGAVGSETYGGTGVVRSVLDDGAAAEIFGSCLFSDPSSDSAESILIAATGEAYMVATADGAVTTIGYPTGETLSGAVDLRQSHDRIFLFRDGEQSWELLNGATDFTVCDAGVFTQPQVFEVTGGDVDVVSGLATFTVVGNTTIAAGDMVRIYGTDNADFEAFIGREFKSTAASATAISFYIPVADLATINTDVISIGKQVSIGAGFSFLPAPPWGVYHQRRLIVPYRYTQTGNTAAPTYTARNVEDELVMSDILDPHTYDTALNQFRITAGIADSMVGVHPFSDDRLLVFMRNSIHLITGISGALSDCQTVELTREVGLLARKSVAQYASQVLFLADNGVYAVGFFDEYNLRPVGEPLSAEIQPVIDRINANLAPLAVGVYFNNRYWLAVPLDSSPGAGDATGNNAVLVYNFLNPGWESVDSVDDSRWNILNLHISRAVERNDLYAVNTFGGVHKIEALDSDQDRLALTPGDDVESVPVASGFETREYGPEDGSRERFTRVQMLISSAGQASDANITFTTTDPDSENMIGSFSGNLGGALGANEGASIRPRVGGYRGHGASVRVTPVSGRPKIRSVSLEGSTANRSTVPQQ